jgi:trimethylamine--corrinoid protein Co-methyltransferase
MLENRLRLGFLSDSALDQIEETAYRLLDEVGITLQHHGAREMLHGHGCRIDGARAFVPREAVEWALENVSPHRDWYCMDGSPGFTFGDGQIRFHNGGGPPFIYDLDTSRRRKATLQDVADVTRLLDALPNVDVVIPLFGPQDVPSELMVVASTEVTLRNTRKPVSSAAVDKPQHVPYVVQMAAACCGGIEHFRQHPTMSISVSPVSPLIFTHDVAASIIAIVQAGVPFHSLPAPSLGATAPITMAGALAQQHAEVLASFVIAATARPGAPVVYCSRINPNDLRTAVSSWGGPEVGMAGACATQLAHRLGLPCDAYGLCSGATFIDPQFAYERLTNAFVPALAGTDIMSGVGGTDSGLAGGLEIAVIDDEMIGVLKHVVAGCEVNDETLAFDVMQAVIPRDGVFLSERHTIRHMRAGAIWNPGVSERKGQEVGGAGAGVVARAREQARAILKTHQVPPLSEDVERELGEIMARARRELSPDI